MNCMFVSPPNSYVETLTLPPCNVMVFEGRAFGEVIRFRKGHEVEVLIMELEEEMLELSL